MKTVGVVLAFLTIGLGSVEQVANAWGPARDLPDQKVATSIGTFAFTQLRCDQAGGSVFLWGTITNQTNRVWNEVVLSVAFRDKNGDVLISNNLGEQQVRALYLHLKDLGVGQSQKFSYHAFGHSDKATAEPVLVIVDGDFPVEYILEMVKPNESKVLSFETDHYSISFSAAPTAMHFVLRNKGDGPMRIDWNSVAFVDVSGRSQGVLHNGIKFADRAALKSPSVIPPGASIEDDIVPVESVEFVDMQWITHRLLPTSTGASELLGKDFSVFMPLDVDGKVENRTFVFRVGAIN
jgi:hypothetical protein